MTRENPPVSEDRTSAGDPVQTLRLLWRTKMLSPQTGSRAGRPRALDVDTVVSAAIALADAEGLGRLTMRRLAASLDVRPMTLYTYVPGRAEMLDLMLDSVYASMPRDPHLDRPWQDRVRAVADANRAMFRQHPWAASVSTLRPPPGPGQMVKYEHELNAFTGSGLDDLQTDDALNHLLTFVRANAHDATALEQTRHREGTEDHQWWAAVQPLLAEVLDPDVYPLATRIGAAAGAARNSAHDPGHAYTFGLELMIEALELLSRPD